MRRRALISFALLVAGCGGAAKSPNPDCDGKVTCPVSSSQIYAAEVVPVATSADTAALPAEEVGELMLDTANSRFRMMLADPSLLTGMVQASADHPQPLAATVLASRPSRIIGRPDVSYQTKVDAMTGAFSLAVSPTLTGEVYTVRVLPDDSSSYPPMTFLVDASQSQQLPVQAPPASSLVQVRGVILDALQLPVVGMTVSAVDPSTNVTLSTTNITDSGGAFLIKLAPAPVTVGGVATPALVTTVRLVATPAKGAAQPTLETSLDLSKVGPANTLTANLMMPPLPSTTTLVLTVQGVGSSGSQSAIVGAHCVFSADVSDPASTVIATYQAEGDTDANGKASFTLIPAADGNRNYQVAVSPPSSSNFQATLTTVPVAAATTGPNYGAPITLALRAQVTGRVLGPDLMPLKNVTVVPTAATLAAAATQTTFVAAPKASSGLTDGNGHFLLRLDAGAYDFAMIPTATTVLPHHWVDGQQISTDITLPDVVLPAGAMVAGSITDVTGLPLAGADVRLYQLVPSNVDCGAGDTSCLSPARLTAEAQTGTDGLVLMLLPAAD